MYTYIHTHTCICMCVCVCARMLSKRAPFLPGIMLALAGLVVPIVYYLGTSADESTQLSLGTLVRLTRPRWSLIGP